MNEWDRSNIQRMPWYAALRPVVKNLDLPPTWPTLADYQRVLDCLPQPILTTRGAPLRVVTQKSDKTSDWRQTYEARIYLKGELQTRLESWHDCFNLLTWASFPTSKASLNARQYALLAACSTALPAAARSPKQDALTQFDESGVIVLCSEPALITLLLEFQWKPLFWENRAKVSRQMRCFLFGHGLMERALTPYLGLTGKGVILPVNQDFFTQALATQLRQADRLLAQYLENRAYLLHPKDLAPVPFLGFPGFSPDNEQAEYYNDQRYFRPGRGLRL